MRWLTSLAGYVAPIFLILSPVLSYSDQAMAMHRNKSSAGFSLDIPLIMLIASMFRYAASKSSYGRACCLTPMLIMFRMQDILLPGRPIRHCTAHTILSDGDNAAVAVEDSSGSPPRPSIQGR